MSLQSLKDSLYKLTYDSPRYGRQERLRAAKLLLTALSEQITQLHQELREDGAAARRRKAKSRETEVDPKPPVKPVRVAEPSKPRKPKYSGNHAPSAPRR